MTTPDTRTDPIEPAPARRSARRRAAAVAAAVVLPVAAAGWLGWHTLADAGDGHIGPAAAPPAASPTGSPTASAAASAEPSPPTPTTPTSPAAGAPTAGAPGAGGPLAGKTVLLDPGHNPGNGRHSTEINRQVDIGNGHKECDTTGTATDAGYTEADYTLDVVHRIRDLLQAKGAKVVLTQDGDRPWGPCVDERAAIGNAAKADAAVSVHGDGAPATGSGFHVIMPARVTAGKADTSGIVDPSHRLGLLLRESFKAATGEPYSDYIGQDGLDTRSDLGGLNLSSVPKVFIECGNMRNSGDVRRMTDPQWRQQAAQGIADALARFLTG